MTAAPEWDGRPEDPEQDGWHWLQGSPPAVPVWWCAGAGAWICGPVGIQPAGMVPGFTYRGPCRPPPEPAEPAAGA